MIAVLFILSGNVYAEELNPCAATITVSTVVKDGKTKLFISSSNPRVGVIQPNFLYAEPFSEGMAGVLIDNKWGYINRKGETVIPPKYDMVWRFSEGRAGVITTKKRKGYSGKQWYLS